jgi:hypothetical protein
MKKVLSVLVALSMLTMMGLAYADTINIGDRIRLNYDPSDTGYSSGHGGAFYLNDISTGDNFYTFCVETGEYFNPSNQYYVGGISDTTDNTKFVLKPEAAYIYWTYRMNNIPGTGNQNGDIQEAIWYALGEVAFTTISPGAQAIYSDAVDAVNTGNWSGIGDVRVLNLYSSYSATDGSFSGYAQDQLALITAVPEPNTFLLLGAGLAGLGLLRRRFKS